LPIIFDDVDTYDNEAWFYDAMGNYVETSGILFEFSISKSQKVSLLLLSVMTGRERARLIACV
jgi:hypothetical protein